ncbi:IS481 family transposase [Chitinimonas sp.]|uniref:IS481 family transposase n=1 Tax=Chitinimonas sp. TaxID=1934313 RepID=UPI0035AF01EE
MPWKPLDTMSLRSEFVQLALQEGCNFRDLCRRFRISAKTGYKWRKRFDPDSPDSLADQSRVPKHSPARTDLALEALVVSLRHQHPCWGGRKLQRRLLDLGHIPVPSPSTITGILHRHGLITPTASEQPQAWQRFEHDQPNALWQIDFKGYFDTLAGRCHPLTLIDDHSRYNLTLVACERTDTATVQAQLQAVFERYGLPVRINADNGAPWGSPSDPSHGITQLTVWLIRLGIRVSHSRPFHPQTNGKDERFHRTLKAGVLNGRSFQDLTHVQQAFDQWREVYNQQRPHEALAMATPVTRYRPSPLVFPIALRPIEYGPDDQVIEVGWNGWFRFRQREIKVSNALHRLPIAIRPDPLKDGVFEVRFCHQRLMTLDLHTLPPKT